MVFVFQQSKAVYGPEATRALVDPDKVIQDIVTKNRFEDKLWKVNDTFKTSEKSLFKTTGVGPFTKPSTWDSNFDVRITHQWTNAENKPIVALNDKDLNKLGKDIQKNFNDQFSEVIDKNATWKVKFIGLEKGEGRDADSAYLKFEIVRDKIREGF